MIVLFSSFKVMILPGMKSTLCPYLRLRWCPLTLKKILSFGSLLCLLVPEDESLRPCMDYKGLKKIEVKNGYLPLGISELFDHIKGYIISPDWIYLEYTIWFKLRRKTNGRPFSTWMNVYWCPLVFATILLFSKSSLMRSSRISYIWSV